MVKRINTCDIKSVIELYDQFITYSDIDIRCHDRIENFIITRNTIEIST